MALRNEVWLKHISFQDVCCRLIALGPDGHIQIEWYRVGISHSVSLDIDDIIRLDDFSQWIFASGASPIEAKWETFIRSEVS